MAESTVVLAGLFMPCELGGLVFCLMIILSLECWCLLGPGSGLFTTGTLSIGLLARSVGGFGMVLDLNASSFLWY